MPTERISVPLQDAAGSSPERCPGSMQLALQPQASARRQQQRAAGCAAGGSDPALELKAELASLGGWGWAHAAAEPIASAPDDLPGQAAAARPDQDAVQVSLWRTPVRLTTMCGKGSVPAATLELLCVSGSLGCWGQYQNSSQRSAWHCPGCKLAARWPSMLLHV